MALNQKLCFCFFQTGSKTTEPQTPKSQENYISINFPIAKQSALQYIQLRPFSIQDISPLA